MFWNIVIAVGAGAAQLVTGWLGFRVRLHPPKTDRQIKIYDASFVIVGLTGLSLIGLITYRAGRKRAHLALTQTEQSFAPNPFPVNQPLSFNLYIKNVGEAQATKEGTFGRIFYEPDVSISSQRDAISAFTRTLDDSQPIIRGTTLAKDQTLFFTATGPIVSPTDYDDLINGRRVIYVLAAVPFDDDTGNHIQYFCEALQAPMPHIAATQRIRPMIWAMCNEHTNEQ